MGRYLYAIQDSSGREIVSVELEVDKVSDVRADQAKRGNARIVTIAQLDGPEIGWVEVPEDAELTLYRWPADDKTSEPVAHEVRAENIEES